MTLKRRDFISGSAGLAAFAGVIAATEASTQRKISDAPPPKPASSSPDRVTFLCAVRGALARRGDRSC
jgi:hypothetical protein